MSTNKRGLERGIGISVDLGEVPTLIPIKVVTRNPSDLPVNAFGLAPRIRMCRLVLFTCVAHVELMRMQVSQKAYCGDELEQL